MDINFSEIVTKVYENPFIGIIIAAASFFLIGYLIKKLKSIIVFIVVAAFIAGFYFYNRDSKTISLDTIKNVKDIDVSEMKTKAEFLTDESREKFFEAFSDPRESVK